MLTPRQQAPDLVVNLVGGGKWSLAEQAPESFTLVVFYRGLHCPVCKGYLRDLERRLDDLAQLGVTSVVAVSGDDEERATASVRDWGLDRLAVGYGQSIDSMREWGLYVSRSIKDSEPELFGEPGLFLLRPDGTVYFAAYNSMPFARPRWSDVLDAIRFVLDRDYPARGES